MYWVQSRSEAVTTWTDLTKFDYTLLTRLTSQCRYLYVLTKLRKSASITTLLGRGSFVIILLVFNFLLHDIFDNHALCLVSNVLIGEKCIRTNFMRVWCVVHVYVLFNVVIQ